MLVLAPPFSNLGHNSSSKHHLHPGSGRLGPILGMKASLLSSRQMQKSKRAAGAQLGSCCSHHQAELQLALWVSRRQLAVRRQLTCSAARLHHHPLRMLCCLSVNKGQLLSGIILYSSSLWLLWLQASWRWGCTHVLHTVAVPVECAGFFVA